VVIVEFVFTYPGMGKHTWAPAKIEIDIDAKKTSGPGGEIKHYIYDTTTYMQVYIDKDIIPSYYWTENDSTFFRNKTNTYYSNNDSLLYYKTKLTGRVKSADMLIKMDDSHNIKKMRILLNGDTLYSVYSFLPEEFLNTKDYQKLFNDFRISNEVRQADLFTRKPVQLLKALQTSDRTEFELAKLNFEKQNLYRKMCLYYSRPYCLITEILIRHTIIIPAHPFQNLLRTWIPGLQVYHLSKKIIKN
jgi:hypothetical protein